MRRSFYPLIAATLYLLALRSRKIRRLPIARTTMQ